MERKRRGIVVNCPLGQWFLFRLPLASAPAVPEAAAAEQEHEYHDDEQSLSVHV